MAEVILETDLEMVVQEDIPGGQIPVDQIVPLQVAHPYHSTPLIICVEVKSYLLKSLYTRLEGS